MAKFFALLIIFCEILSTITALECRADDGKVLKLGESYAVPGKCRKNICDSNGDIFSLVCQPNDLTKPFPECCECAINGLC